MLVKVNANEILSRDVTGTDEKHSLRGVRRVHAARPQKHAQDAKRRAQKSRHLTVTVIPRVSRDCRTSSNKQKTCSIQQTHSSARARSRGKLSTH